MDGTNSFGVHIVKPLMELLEFIHTKRYTLTLTQMSSLDILGHILYLESI
jgi:hypothetical protein